MRTSSPSLSMVHRPNTDMISPSVTCTQSHTDRQRVKRGVRQQESMDQGATRTIGDHRPLDRYHDKRASPLSMCVYCGLAWSAWKVRWMCTMRVDTMAHTPE
jgi:hypothetical protein